MVPAFPCGHQPTVGTIQVMQLDLDAHVELEKAPGTLSVPGSIPGMNTNEQRGEYFACNASKQVVRQAQLPNAYQLCHLFEHSCQADLPWVDAQVLKGTGRLRPGPLLTSRRLSALATVYFRSSEADEFRHNDL